MHGVLDGSLHLPQNPTVHKYLRWRVLLLVAERSIDLLDLQVSRALT